MTKIVTLLPLLGSIAVAGSASAQPPLEQQGRTLAARMCGQCHAIDETAKSPHVSAPAFRTLDRRVELDAFMDRLRDGLTSGHPDMPTFRFTRQDARALIAYLRTIQAP